MRRFLHALLMLAALLGCGGSMAALQGLPDQELAHVHGRDGFAFNLRGFSLDGSLSLRLGDSLGGGLSLGNISLSRSDDLGNTFADPYQLTLLQRSEGQTDRVSLSGPLNSLGLLRWQFAADLSLIDSSAVAAGGQLNRFQAGALLLQDLRSYGMRLDLAPNPDPETQGIAFGLSLRLDLGALTLRPRGRDNISLLDSPGAPEQFSLKGLHLAAATADMQVGSQAWSLANLDSQPLLLNTVANADGSASLHLNLAWPTAGQQAPTGSLSVDNIAFKSDVGGNLDLGSSRIGGLQIQYLDIKLKAGR